MLIFLRNTVAGFDAVPRDVLEAADGMGYTQWYRFQLVEIPLAIPLIVAGVRLATVSTIGCRTISDPRRRLRRAGVLHLRGPSGAETEIFTGTLVTIVLAITVDVLLVLLQRRLTPWTRQRARAAAAATGST